MEGFVTAIVDLFPQHLRHGHRKEIFIGLCSIFWFLLGLSMVTEVISYTVASIEIYIIHIKFIFTCDEYWLTLQLIIHNDLIQHPGHLFTFDTF